MQISKQLFSAVAEKDSISNFLENTTNKMQDDIFDNINSEFYVDQIIICNTIAIKKDLEQETFNLINVIHVVIKKCEQFSKKC